ncbi:MAG: DUF885 domain-containing protein [bacterium]|nr:DUF885 domain-containing protein [bacterium]
MTLRFPLIVLSIVSLLGTADALSAAAAGDAAGRVKALADEFYEAKVAQIPESVFVDGVPVERHDGLADHSPAALEAWWKFEDRLLADLQEIEEDVLRGHPEWIIYGVLKEALEASIQLRVCRRELWAVNQMEGWQLLYPRVATLQPVDDAELRKQALTRWRKFPRFVRTETANLKTGLQEGYSSPKGNVRRVLGQLDGLLAVPLDDSPFMAPARRGKSPEFHAAFRRLVAEEILPAVREYRDFLEGEYLPRAREAIAVSALPNGRACYRASIRSETTLDRTPEEVYELGKRTVAANRARVVELGERLYGTRDFAEIIRRVDRDPGNRFETREEVLAFARAVVTRSKDALPQWFTTLPKRDAVVEPYPDYQDGTGVSSRYEPPRGDQPGVFRITLHEPQEQRKGRAEIVAIHEAYPGHHLQIAITWEKAGLHKIRRLIFNSGYTEGWARYGEALAEEMGLYKTQTALISRRTWPARGMVVDPGIHIMGWTRTQAIEFLKESGRFSSNRAEEMVDRIAILPAQLTAYDSGALEIFALRARAEEALGDRFDVREFHDRLLENGMIPLPMLRRHVEAWIADLQASDRKTGSGNSVAN